MSAAIDSSQPPSHHRQLHPHGPRPSHFRAFARPRTRLLSIPLLLFPFCLLAYAPRTPAMLHALHIGAMENTISTILVLKDHIGTLMMCSLNLQRVSQSGHFTSAYSILPRTLLSLWTKKSNPNNPNNLYLVGIALRSPGNPRSDRNNR
jgi:hypothetical protein